MEKVTIEWTIQDVQNIHRIVTGRTLSRRLAKTLLHKIGDKLIDHSVNEGDFFISTYIREAYTTNKK